MSIYLRVTEESSTKMGILRFSILILFTSFPTFSISTGVQILGFLIFGVGVLIRIAVSLLPGVSSLEGEFPPTTGKFPCKPSNRPSMLAMAWVDMLESDLFGRCSIVFFLGWSIVFFWGGCHRCFAVKYSKFIVDTQSDIRST